MSLLSREGDWRGDWNGSLRTRGWRERWTGKGTERDEGVKKGWGREG